ncbi:MAG: hypothetical protein K5928_01270 [Prevotella sp.]|nr:hypothetical protein [Prevotella sp.]
MKKIYLFLAAALLTACTTELQQDESSAPRHHARLELQPRIVCFAENEGQGTTRADAGWTWPDGAVIYMQYYNGTERITGHAIYNAAEASWEGYFNGQLAASGRCELYHLEGAAVNGTGATADRPLQHVSLTPANAVYADREATYALGQGTVRVQAALKPLTARLRMKGSRGLTAEVYGLTRYTAYDAEQDTLSADTTALTVSIGNDGYSTRQHVLFTHPDTRQLSLINNQDDDLLFTRRFSTQVLTAGTAGYITIPTAATNTGWEEREKDKVSASPTTLTFAWDETTAQTVSVSSNGAWTATTTASWLTVGGGSGTADGSFTVRPNSNKTGSTARTATVTVSCGTATPVTISVTQNTKTTEGYDNGHAWVDLGLSVRWATMNVGASSATDYGDYYAWGETTTKSSYLWRTYKYCNGSYSTLTKYNNSSSYGTVDNKTTLEPADDVAHVKWGGNWRMPTYSELLELYDNCDRTWYEEGNTEFGGVAGWKVTSKKDGYTDKYIFLPAAGFRADTVLDCAGSDGYYWSSSLNEADPNSAHDLYFYSSGHGLSYGSHRCYGYSVRPVSEQ